MNSQRLIGVIATREFMARIRSRTFGITTALTVIAIGAYILLQAYVFNKSTTSLDVGFTSAAQAISAPVKAEAASLGVTITVHPIGSTAAGQADVRSGTLDALVSGSGAGTTVTVQSTVDPTMQTVLNDVAREQVLTEYLTQHGLPPGDVEGQLAFSVSVNALAPINAERVQEIVIPQLSSGSAVVAVRVDPADHSKVAIDFSSEVPEVTLARTTDNAHSAAYLLANGKPIKVVLVGNQPLGKKNADGVEMYALQLTAYEGVDTPYQLTVGNPVPASALPLLFPGSKLHARLGDDPNAVVVDWAAGSAA